MIKHRGFATPTLSFPLRRVGKGARSRRCMVGKFAIAPCPPTSATEGELPTLRLVIVSPTHGLDRHHFKDEHEPPCDPVQLLLLQLDHALIGGHREAVAR